VATQPTYPAPLAQPAHATTERGPGLLARWRAHRAERRQARVVSARNRRVLAQWLRRTVHHPVDRDPTRRRREILLCDRVAAVRTELLEIAALLECGPDPDPACVVALHGLLASGCDSPLYNADVHISELRATLYYVQAELASAAEHARRRPI
jgi:hypothetical protein